MPHTPRKNEKASLVLAFFIWKILLLTIAYLSPGNGYDTSTTLLGASNSSIVDRLTRWDAIYFSAVAQRGYVFEQEWAFGWGYSQLLRLLVNGRDRDGFPLYEAWAGIAVSHVSHLISVLVLHDMSKNLFSHRLDTTSIPFIASLLHVISPAGLFLSAPYSESLFSCLSFVGYSLFVRSVLEKKAFRKDILQLASAAFMALAASTRGNGLLNGLLFASEALYCLVETFQVGFQFDKLRRIMVISICGCLVGLGNAFPQYLAYRQFCLTEAAYQRSWCRMMLPSIYNFVQSHYWNAGFLKYWTIPNLPLFVFAIPGVALFTRSSIWAWNTDPQDDRQQKGQTRNNQRARHALRILAMPQAVLLVLLTLRYHVQIITRLSSGYPVWYWWLAENLSRRSKTGRGKTAKATIVWMVVYGMLQGALFASFLPPA